VALAAAQDVNMLAFVAAVEKAADKDFVSDKRSAAHRANALLFA